MSAALNGSTVLQRFERGNAVEIRNEIMLDFYPGLPHIAQVYTDTLIAMLRYTCILIWGDTATHLRASSRHLQIVSFLPFDVAVASVVLGNASGVEVDDGIVWGCAGIQMWWCDGVWMNRILSTDSIVVDHKLGATFTLHELAVSDHDLYCTV